MVSVQFLFPCLLLILQALQAQCRFRCHNRCSGHGYCSDYDNVCYCKEGYQGVDCSERTCAVDAAWADKAYEVDKAHHWAECSNAGKCNRRTGVCDCTPGFTGVACEKLKCGGTGPEGCNGHGDCITLGETYQMMASVSGLDLPTLYEKDKLPAWEANHVTMCSCHPGYSGASCEYRLCPKGDDPMTPHTGHRTITLNINSLDVLSGVSGNLLFHFNGQSFWFPVGAAAFDALQCELAFQSLRNIADVVCSVTHDLFNIVYTIQLRSFPVLPYETSIYTNDGNPPLESFSCNTDELVLANSFNSVKCWVGETGTDKSYPEYAPCANRGICDFTTGVCYCFPQFSGANCASYKKAIAVATEREVSSSEVLTVESSNPDFASTVLRFQTFDVATEDFRSINVDNLDRNVFNMDGAGNMNMNYGSLIIGDTNNSLSSGMTVNTGGLSVTGGVTAYTDTLVVNGPVFVATGGVSIVNGGLRIAGDAQFNGNTEIAGGLSASGGLRLMGGLYIGAGGGTIKYGGLTVSGGLTIVSAGLTVNKRGVTILSGGLAVTGGIRLNKVKSSITVNAAVSVVSGGVGVVGGIYINNEGFVTDSGMSINSGGLVVSSATINTGGVSLTGGVTVHAAGFTVTGGLSVEDVGMIVDGTVPSQVTGGATVYASGIVVPSGLTVSDSGLVVTGGVTVPINDVYVSAMQVKSFGVQVPLGRVSVGSGGLYVTGGVTLANNGLFVASGGLSVQASGLRVVSGGMTVFDGGLSVIAGGLAIGNTGLLLNDRLSIPRDGLKVTGGVTIRDATGVTLTGGLSVASLGFKVTGGVTVRSGLRFTGGVTIADSGLTITGGATLSNNGIRVYGGLTNFGTVGLLLTGGLSVTSSGIRVTSGMIINDSGLSVASGLTVDIAGITVTGGLTVIDTGLSIASSGLVLAPSLYVTGGLTLSGTSPGGLVVEQGMTVTNGGQIVGGWSVTAGGMRVNLGGVTVGGGGVRIANGVTVASGGVRAYSASGDSGLLLSGGLTIRNNGLKILDTGSLLVRSSGLVAAGGLTLSTTGGLEILSGGLTVSSSGLNVLAAGMTVLATGVSVASGGVTIAGGLTSLGTSNLRINNNGLTSDGALTVGASGVFVANGMTVADRGVSVLTNLIVRRGGIVSSAKIATDVGLRVSGDSTISSAGIAIAGGVTVASGGVRVTGPTIASAKSTIIGGLRVSGSAKTNIMDGGVFVLGGMSSWNGANYFEDTNGLATASDRRLKRKIEALGDPLERLLRMRGVSFNWVDPAWDAQSGRALPAPVPSNTTTSYNTSNSLDAKLGEEDERDSLAATAATSIADRTSPHTPERLRFVGVIAQEVQEVLPEVVSPMQVDGADFLSVRYGDIVPLVIEAIKVLDVRTVARAAVAGQPPTERRKYAPAAREGKHKTLQKKSDSRIAKRSKADVDELLHKYFYFDESGKAAIGVRSYNGTCSCGKDALAQAFVLLQRIQVLERTEENLTAQSASVIAS